MEPPRAGAPPPPQASSTPSPARSPRRRRPWPLTPAPSRPAATSTYTGALPPSGPLLTTYSPSPDPSSRTSRPPHRRPCRPIRRTLSTGSSTSTSSAQRPPVCRRALRRATPASPAPGRCPRLHSALASGSAWRLRASSSGSRERRPSEVRLHLLRAASEPLRPRALGPARLRLTARPPRALPCPSATTNPSSGGMAPEKLLLCAVEDGHVFAEATVEKHTTPLLGHEPPAELRRFCRFLRWMCINHGNVWLDVLSWAVFFALAVAVPAMSHLVFSCNEQRRWFDAVVQASLSGTAMLSFMCLREFSRKHDLQRFMTLDRLCSESKRVDTGYRSVLNWFFDSLRIIIIPSFSLEVVYRIWWYWRSWGHIALCEDPRLCALFGTVELLSWIYRSTIFVFHCLLYTALCKLEFLRLEEFSTTFQHSNGVDDFDKIIITWHFRVRHHLSAISHNFRHFLISCHLTVTLLLLATLYLVTTYHFSQLFVVDAIELALCWMTILTGVLVSLDATAKVTNRAQSIAVDAANWHACSTLKYRVPAESFQAAPYLGQAFNSFVDPPKRREIVSYIQNNKAGITIFGSFCDSRWFLMLFSIELSLVPWLMGKILMFSYALR